eukprot:CAMPEP_0171386158 /NCGR_PEP_ID=MMETSP0879-20121228/39352_1 /TAXON_ID=67004 /ORGANISM="Thalassiosira weissflogii, Strain CCMP1336" /LENGTH=375 /DNA_ID=CAMNT_0011898475 /DNA_START=481 /DNA_END=1609 /DNA_ORIENTATION=-
MSNKSSCQWIGIVLRVIQDGRTLSVSLFCYVEQEFLPMDWNCPKSDPRWEVSDLELHFAMSSYALGKIFCEFQLCMFYLVDAQDSLSIVVLRHPIERHMSEFFYKGPGGNRENGFKLDKQKLHTDEEYSQQLSEFIYKYLPPWMAKKGSGPHRQRDNDFKWFFIGEVYMDNFQLRSLAGCSSGECMKRYHMRKGKLERMEEGFRASTGFYTEPISACTNFFDVMCKPHLDKRLCRNRVDGPCFYPAVAWGDMSEDDLARGIKALEAFDVVLLMEKLNDEDQSAFFADVMGVHRDVTFSFNNMSSEAMNSQVGKASPREVTHFYRDILSRFELLRDVQNLLYEENRLEIALFERAIELNSLMIDQWKTETKWEVSV